MPPAHMIFFTVLVLDKIKAQWGFRSHSIGDSQLFPALKAHWILIAGISLCILVQTALALFQPIFKPDTIGDFSGLRILCAFLIWSLSWSVSRGEIG